MKEKFDRNKRIRHYKFKHPNMSYAKIGRVFRHIVNGKSVPLNASVVYRIINRKPKLKTFIEMWNEADEVDAAIGGIDSIPINELKDYNEACVIATSGDLEYGQSLKEKGENNGDR